MSNTSLRAEFKAQLDSITNGQAKDAIVVTMNEQGLAQVTLVGTLANACYMERAVQLYILNQMGVPVMSSRGKE